MTIERVPPFSGMKFTESDGDLTAGAYLYNDQLNQVITKVVNFFIDGVQFPQKTTAEITALEPASGNGTVWFNATLGKLQVKTASGTIETITSA